MPIPFEPITTERLILRRFRPGDLTEFAAYRNDQEVARYQGWDTIDDVSAARFIEEQQARVAGEPGLWLQIAIEVQASRRLAGDLAILVRRDDPLRAEIGYTLARSFQYHGFATEAVTALLDFAFGPLGLHRMLALVDTRNRPSAALVERLNFRREGHHIQSFWNKGEWTDEYTYALLGHEWLSRDGDSRPPV